jgi:hypothetical protein
VRICPGGASHPRNRSSDLSRRAAHCTWARRHRGTPPRGLMATGAPPAVHRTDIYIGGEWSPSSDFGGLKVVRWN